MTGQLRETAPGRRWLPSSQQAIIAEVGAFTTVLCIGFLFLPLAGTDLSAQVARGHFFDEYGSHLIDFRWYGGTHPFGYSLLTGPANALLGSRGIGAVSCVISALAFTWYVIRMGVQRPRAAGIAYAIMGVFNLVSGRTTFALGLALGLLALCALETPLTRRGRLLVAAMLAALTTAASPVAGAFLGLAGLIYALTRRRADAAALIIGASAPIMPMILAFRDGGEQPFTAKALWTTLAVCVVSYFMIPASYRIARWGVAITAVATTATFVVATPMGSNITRLPLLFAIPAVIAVAQSRWLPLAIAALVAIQPPLMVRDLAYAGEPGVNREFFQPLINELQRRQPVGRVEVVPLAAHWESVYVAEAVPLARGWMRQVDTARNPLFYDESLNAETYYAWLQRNAVEYVAMPRDIDTSHGVRLDWAARDEAALIERGIPYLTQVWASDDWQLYAVRNPTPLVESPATLITSDPTGVKFQMPERGTVVVRVGHSPWLALKGPRGSIHGSSTHSWVKITIEQPGTYTLTSRKLPLSPW